MRDRRKKFIFATKPKYLHLSAYTDACTSSCKIAVASKRPFIICIFLAQ